MSKFSVKIIGGSWITITARTAENAAKRAAGGKRGYLASPEGNGIYVVTKRARFGGELVVARVCVAHA